MRARRGSRSTLGGGPRLFVKRDDALSFAFGGNKVRKVELVLSEALGQHADTLVTIGGVHSKHVRVTASAAARAGLKCVLVINGQRPVRPSGNALLDELELLRRHGVLLLPEPLGQVLLLRRVVVVVTHNRFQ